MNFFRFLIGFLGKPKSRKKKRLNAWLENQIPFPDEKPVYQAEGPLVRKHFALVDQIELAWKSQNRLKIISLCRAQIQICEEVRMILADEERLNQTGTDVNQFSHTGFYRLAMLFEKEGNFSEAIKVCEEGISKGWSQVELEHRAARCRRKIEKQTATGEVS